MPWRALIGKIAFLLLLLPAALFSAAAGAEVLDDLTVFQERADAVVRITFGVRIQYLRTVIVGSDLFEIYFQIVSAEGVTVQESRRIASSATFPGVEVTYPLQPRFQAQKLIVRFTRAVTLRVRPSGNQAIDLIIPDGGRLLGRAPDGAPAEPARIAAEPASVAAEPARETATRFVIRLDSFRTLEDLNRAPPVPREFSNFEVLTSEARRDGRTEYDVLLGYFGTAETAERVHQRLRQRYPRAEIIDLGELPREPARTAVSPAAPKPAPAPVAVTPPVPVVTPPAPVAVTPPAPVVTPPAPIAVAPPTPPVAPPAPVAAKPPMVAAPAPVTPPTPPAVTAPSPPPASTEEVEASAAELLSGANVALNTGDYTVATEKLNQLLMLPPNRQSQEAQELIGLARERSGETAKARAEYELYLRLFPDGDGAARVRKRLLALGADAPPAPRPDRAPVRAVSGSLSQYYYGGRTKIDTAFNTPTTPDRSSFAATDQSLLVTNLDLTLRSRSESADTRFVLRDTNSRSFLDTTSSYNRLNAAYYEYRGLQNSFTTRIGRQTGLSGGLPSRFDGAIAGLGIARKWRVNAAAGVPVEYPTIDSKRRFWATNLEYENLGDALSGNFFYVDQSVDGVLDRRAVGNETRYVRGGTSLFSLLDYDTSYQEWNITMLQGTWQTEGRTTLNLLYDRRKAPLLTTTNAIFGQPTTSISTLLQTLTLDQVRQQALDVTAMVTQALIGFTTPVSQKWQVGADARLTNVGALPEVVVNGILVPAQPATGDIYSYTAQAIGSNLYSSRDTNVFSATYLDGPTQQGYQLAYNNLSLIAERWTAEPSLRYYTQKDNQQVELTRWTPGLRITYRVRDSVTLETEFNWEQTRTVSPTSQEDTRRGFYYVGYRWNF